MLRDIDPRARLALILGGSALVVVAFMGAGYMLASHLSASAAVPQSAAAPTSMTRATSSISGTAAPDYSFVPTAEPFAVAPRQEVRSIAATSGAGAVTAAGPGAAKPKPHAPVATGPSLDAYAGLGSWVDIYDDRAWANPSATVKDMAGRGVHTLYIETSNSRSPFAIKDVAKMRAFIDAAHARRMRVVAWYLPDLRDLGKDYDRIRQAIRFRSSTGQGFDSFALDIESGAVSSVTARNGALGTLSARIRGLVGPKYPLGAITPSPTGLARKGGYWQPFPYSMLAAKYDVFVPMSYYTYHGDGSAKAYADTVSNMRILRSQKGCGKVPIHLIGGISEESSSGEVAAFVRAARVTKAFGGSLYSWDGTTLAHWTSLRALRK